MRRIAMTVAAVMMVSTLVACNKSASTAEKGKPAGAAASALDVMPATTAGLAGVNVKKVVASKAWQQYGTKALSDPEIKGKLDKMKADCGFDPLTDIDSIAVGADGTGDAASIVVIIKGNFDADKIGKCAVAAAAQNAKKMTVKTEGKITAMSVEGETEVAYVGWVAKDTMVIVPQAIEKNDKALLEKVLNATDSAKNNKQLADLMGNVNTGHTGWGAIDTTKATQVADAISGSIGGAKPLGLWVNLAYENDLDAEIGMRFATPEEAKKTVETLGPQLKAGAGQTPMGDLSSAIKIEAKGSDAVLTVKLTGDQIQKIIDMVGPMMGGMLGGM
jgi:hypothetical protein